MPVCKDKVESKTPPRVYLKSIGQFEVDPRTVSTKLISDKTLVKPSVTFFKNDVRWMQGIQISTASRTA